MTQIVSVGDTPSQTQSSIATQPLPDVVVTCLVPDTHARAGPVPPPSKHQTNVIVYADKLHLSPAHRLFKYCLAGSVR
jgi:hypothetical protein